MECEACIRVKTPIQKAVANNAKAELNSTSASVSLRLTPKGRLCTTLV